MQLPPRAVVALVLLPLLASGCAATIQDEQKERIRQTFDALPARPAAGRRAGTARLRTQRDRRVRHPGGQAARGQARPGHAGLGDRHLPGRGPGHDRHHDPALQQLARGRRRQGSGWRSPSRYASAGGTKRSCGSGCHNQAVTCWTPTWSPGHGPPHRGPEHHGPWRTPAPAPSSRPTSTPVASDTCRADRAHPKYPGFRARRLEIAGPAAAGRRGTADPGALRRHAGTSRCFQPGQTVASGPAVALGYPLPVLGVGWAVGGDSWAVLTNWAVPASRSRTDAIQLITRKVNTAPPAARKP
ncbi:MAG: hypothetical protein QOE58_3063 [Actinomycetota bacterium]|nr:hypothetical protein [Actinomycetota bacterium]